MNRPNHFTIKELADPSIIAEIGEEATWQKLDAKLFPALDWLRGIFGSILINGRGYKESGLRRSDTKTGSPRSAHKAGQAYDLKPLTTGVNVQQMYAYILANEAEAMRHGITELEDIRDTTTGNPFGGWLHISCRPHTMGNRIRIVRP
jgi:hypothetical protein